MKMHKSPHLFLAFSGLLTSATLIGSGCSPTAGDGDGETTATTDSGSTTETGSGGGAPLKFTFCGPATTCPPDVTGVDLTTAVSFKTDVYPTLTSSCAGGSACHATAALTGLAFGTAAAPLDEAGQQALVAQLKMKSHLADIPNVVAGNWEGSFMMMKLDGCQNEMGAVCTVPAGLTNYIVCAESEVNPNNCGDGMPQSEGSTNNPTPYPIVPEKVNKIRAWIEQGAMFN